jgi:hypothetical protein
MTEHRYQCAKCGEPFYLPIGWRDFAKEIQTELEAYQALRRTSMNMGDAANANHYDGHVKALEWVRDQINKRTA